MPESTAPPTTDLASLLRPGSIAVVGASANPDSPGHDYLRCLVEFGFAGPVYPVHRREPEIRGLKAYPDLASIPGDVEFVISCIPSGGILELLDACAEKGVRTVQLFTGRFSETGREEGAELEREVLRRVRAAGIRLLGPNCMGLHDPGWGISFRPDLPRRTGPVAFLSQSGNNTTEVLLHSDVRGIGYRAAISYGNALDIDEADLLDLLGKDSETRVIGAYIEGVRDGRRFLDALRAAGKEKPVVVFKGGRTGAGARSAVSHTAALAGSSEVWRGALRQAGAIEVHSQDELIDLFVAFTLFPQAPAGRRVGAVGGGGGRAVQAADACTEEGLEVPPLSDDIRSQIRERAPDLWDWIGNPVDQSILAGAGAGVSGAAVLEMMLDSPQFDLLIANVGEDWVLGRPDSARRLNHIVERFAGIGRRSQKPVAYVLGPADSPDEERWRAVEQARTLLVDAGLAVFPTVERAAWALGCYVRWHEGRA
ncbi:MAG: CoA-binding protein [Chloroflexi bacterium]|nr:CoA-binding protein [Chloroflexota bacterium]